MTLFSLQALTWGTVTGAVVSALLLAAAESGFPDRRRATASQAAPRPAQPNESLHLSLERRAQPAVPAALVSPVSRRDVR